MIRPRKTLRRGEPSSAEKDKARFDCFTRAHGYCELRISPLCKVWMPLHGDEFTRGQLCHWKSKRRFGWFESEHQRHIWGCIHCHQASHNSDGKPCPAKVRP